MHRAFEVHMLNEQGKKKAMEVADIFDDALNALDHIILGAGPSREYSLVVTKLEEAAFFAKKAMAQQTENQETK